MLRHGQYRGRGIVALGLGLYSYLPLLPFSAFTMEYFG